MTESTTKNLEHRGDATRLELWDKTHGPLNQQMVDSLSLAPANRVLDVGFGAADTTFRMAAVLAQGEVVGVERAMDLVERANAEADHRGVTNVRFVQGDACNLDFTDGTFDLVWSSRVVHGLPDWLAGIREFRRVTKPGGRVVIREGGQGPSLLPPDIGLGNPGLFTRLAAAQASWFADWRREVPGQVRYTSGWLGLLDELGLEEVTARSFVFDRTAPFSVDEEQMLVEAVGSHQSRESLWSRLDETDRETLTQLADPASPHYVLRRRDIHYLLTASVYSGVVPRG